MTPPPCPPSLFDVRPLIAANQVESAIWHMINAHWQWSRWLTADEITIVLRAGCPEWVLGIEHAS